MTIILPSVKGHQIDKRDKKYSVNTLKMYTILTAIKYNDRLVLFCS